MKRYFLPLLLFISTLCNAQDTINRKFILFLNTGLNIPGNEYGVPKDNYNTGPPNEVYGYALNQGVHYDATALYIPSDKIGLAIKFGMDMNNSMKYPQTETSRIMVNQYMSGVYLSVAPKQSKFNLYFLGLIGVVTANINNSDNSFFNNGGGYGSTIAYIGGNETPGFGIGLALYCGMGVSFNFYKKFYLNFSEGYIISDINFSNGTIENYIASGSSYSTETSQAFMLMTMGILQTNFGIGYQL